MNGNLNLDQLSTRILRTYNDKETEDNWEQLEQLFSQSTQFITSHGDTTSILVVNTFLKNISNVAFEQCLQSERTRLATSVMDLCKALHVFPRVDTVIWDQIVVSLLKVCERVNKVFVQRAKGTLHSLISVIPPKTSLLRLMGGCSSVNKGLRLVSMELLTEVIKVHGDAIPNDEALLNQVKKVISDGLADAASAVREASRAAIAALTLWRPATVNELLGRPKGPVVAAPNVAMSTLSRTSSVARAPRVVTQQGTMLSRQNSILGPQRVNSTLQSSTEVFVGADGVAPKRALRVASSILVNSISTNNLRQLERDGGSVSRKPSTPSASATKGFVKPLDRLTTLKASAVGTKSTLSMTSSRLDLSTVKGLASEILRVSLKSSDWSSRLQCIEKLTQKFSEDGGDTSFGTFGRCLQVAITGLSDTHFKVQTSSLVLAEQVILGFKSQFPEFSKSNQQEFIHLLDLLLVRIGSIAVQVKGKPTPEEARQVAAKLNSSLDPTTLITVYTSSLARSDLGTKQRLYLTSLLNAEVSSSSTSQASFKDITICRSLGARIAPSLEESPDAVSIFCLIYQQSAANYYVTVQQSVKCAPAREILRRAILGCKGEEESLNSTKPDTDQMDVDVTNDAKEDSGSTVYMSVISDHGGEEDGEEGVPVTPIRLAKQTTKPKSVLVQKPTEPAHTPSTLIRTPRSRSLIEMTVQKRIISAIRRVLQTPKHKPVNEAMDPTNADALVSKVRERIRLALDSTAVHNSARIIEPIKPVSPLTPRNVNTSPTKLPQSAFLPPNTPSKYITDDSAEVEALVEAALEQFFQDAVQDDSHGPSSARDQRVEVPIEQVIEHIMSPTTSTLGDPRTPLQSILLQV